MSRTNRRSAFTLIELLTVMAIITLLIGILTPALSAARNRAKKTASLAMVNAMNVGLEAFSADEGDFPASNAVLYADDINNTQGLLAAQMIAWEVTGGSTDLQGANLLLDAMVGRDFLGYDPRAPQVGPGGGGGTAYDRWDPDNDRRQPYISPDGVGVTSANQPPEDAAGQLGTETQPTIDNLLSRVFVDKFGWPFLYYRASTTATQNTPIISTLTNPFAPNYGDGVYDGLDNQFFTSYTTPIASPHKIDEADMPMDPAPIAGSELPNNFAEFIRSFRATSFNLTSPLNIDFARPVKSDRFIILSPGKDGIYGNLDDVGNFAILSTER